MSKALKITIIVIASVLVLLALGLGLGLGLRQNEQPETEVLTLNVDGDNVKRFQLEPGDNVYSYIAENVTEYTDYNTCGWFIEDTLTMPLTEDITIAEDENITIYTRTATLDKLSFTLNDDETTYSVSASSEDISGEVVVPRMYSNESTSGLVTEVAENGFSKDSESPYRNNLTLAVLPNSIETIGTQAFYYNFSMAFINIPYGVTTIGDEAYRSCYSVNSITIPSTVESIGTNSFRIAGLAEVYNYSTFDIELGSTDNGYAGYYTKVVYNASDLVNDKPESRIKTIGNVSYYVYGDDFIALAPTESRATLKEVVLDERTTEINNFAFTYCTALESINMPENVKKLGATAFQNCESLSTAIVIPEGVTEIGNYTFNNCRKLPSVTIPSTVTSIGNYAFTYCANLTYINIPSTVTSIGNYAFNRSGLQSIYIPDSVTSIGMWAFAWCEEMSEIRISENITTLEEATFQHTNISTITIPQSVETFGMAVFNGCASLEEVVFENKFTTISQGLFLNCSSLKQITIPESVTTIESNAFQGTALESITIPANITDIAGNAFWSCNEIKTVNINSVSIYTSLTSNSSCGYILNWGANTVKVLASIVDNPENTNTWLNGSAWTKSESADEDGYYTYTRSL